jgi:hypothetical protein
MFTTNVSPGSSPAGVRSGKLGFLVQVASGSVFSSRILTPSAGSHSYHVKARNSAGTATIFCGTSAIATYMPAFMRITEA